MATRTAASTIQRAAVAVSNTAASTPQLPPHALLAKCLVAPSQIASKLNWQHQRRAMNKNQSAVVLTLDIHKNRIEATLASHPSLQQQQATYGCTTPSSQPSSSSSSPQETTIPYHFQGGKLPQYVKDQLEDYLIQRYHQPQQLSQSSRSKSKSPNVVGVLVSWPVQKDTGHMGAPCGRTLHVVEELLQQETTLFGPTSRPLAFWDAHHHALTTTTGDATAGNNNNNNKTDAWGRCPEYARTTHKDHIHRASVEQYHQDEDLAVQQVWEDFCKVHWPSLVATQSAASSSSSADSTTNCLELEEEEEERSFA